MATHLLKTTLHEGDALAVQTSTNGVWAGLVTRHTSITRRYSAGMAWEDLERAEPRITSLMKERAYVTAKSDINKAINAGVLLIDADGQVRGKTAVMLETAAKRAGVDITGMSQAVAKARIKEAMLKHTGASKG